MQPRSFRSLLLALVSCVLLLGAASQPGLAHQQSGNTGGLRLTFIGCPQGGDEYGPPDGCDTVVEAPDSAMLTFGNDDELKVNSVAPEADGSYVFTSATDGFPNGGKVGLSRFFSNDYNYFTFDGTDDISRWYGEVSVNSGNMREVTVYYWNGQQALIQPGENTLVVNVYGCGEGVDPERNPEDCRMVSGPQTGVGISSTAQPDLDWESHLQQDGGKLTYSGLPPYTNPAVRVPDMIPGWDRYMIMGQADEFTNDAAIANMVRGETREINVYYYNPNGEATMAAPTPTSTATATATAEANHATLRVFMISCPDGATPFENRAECKETIEDDGTAQVTYIATGETRPLNEFDQDTDGAYVIPNAEGGIALTGIEPVNRDRVASDADVIEGNRAVYKLQPGQTRDAHIYYFDNP